MTMAKRAHGPRRGTAGAAAPWRWPVLGERNGSPGLGSLLEYDCFGYDAHSLCTTQMGEIGLYLGQLCWSQS
jgi:hypothetical protein